MNTKRQRSGGQREQKTANSSNKTNIILTANLSNYANWFVDKFSFWKKYLKKLWNIKNKAYLCSDKSRPLPIRTAYPAGHFLYVDSVQADLQFACHEYKNLWFDQSSLCLCVPLINRGLGKDISVINIISSHLASLSAAWITGITAISFLFWLE